MKKVLVVDDEADVLKLVVENLLIRGYQVSEAKNGTEALNQLRIGSPALMVLDIKLPDFTGLELLNRIANDPLITASFPVLVMTASITDANIDLENYPNVIEILIKPFSIARLITMVTRILNNHGYMEGR
jgi:CheY-like chemotaxis protein